MDREAQEALAAMEGRLMARINDAEERTIGTVGMLRAAISALSEAHHGTTTALNSLVAVWHHRQGAGGPGAPPYGPRKARITVEEIRADLKADARRFAVWLTVIMIIALATGIGLGAALIHLMGGHWR